MQPKWIERAKGTYDFHRLKIKKDSKWTMSMTASVLRRSIGSVSEDLLICRWLKTHEKQLERFSYTYEALKFIRKKQREEELDEID